MKYNTYRPRDRKKKRGGEKETNSTGLINAQKERGN
jgi:hypothetical protein